jgi:hypothetical protein
MVYANILCLPQSSASRDIRGKAPPFLPLGDTSGFPAFFAEQALEPILLFQVVTSTLDDRVRLRDSKHFGA